MGRVTDRNRQRLTELMEARKDQLGRTWREIADLGGLTDETLRQVRLGTGEIRRKTRDGIDAGLGWVARKGVDSILAGDDPTPVYGPPGRTDVDWQPGRIGAHWQTYRVTADESLNLLQVAYKKYGDGGFWQEFDRIYFGREDTQRSSHESPSDQQGQSA